MTDRPWKLVLLLAGIFLAGAVVGALITGRIERRENENRRAPERWAPNHIEKMTRELRLTSDQVERLQPVVRRHMMDLRRARARSMGESRAVFEEMWREIAGVLTPEQRVVFDRRNQDFRDRVRQRTDELLQQRADAGRLPPRP